MAQHDYDIANQSGSAFRADLNNALAAIVSNNSGASAPATTYAYQTWIDSSTSPATIKRRDGSNASWVTVGYVDGSLGAVTGSSFAPTSSTVPANGIYLPAANTVGLATNSTGRLFINSSGQVGIGTSAPSFPIESKITGADSTIWGYNVAQFADASANNTGLRIATNTSTSGLTQLVAATASAASQFGFWTYNGSAWGERMRLTSTGLGIGTTPDSPLHVVGTSGTGLRIGYTNNTNYFDANTQIFRSNNAATTYGQWDSSGRFLVGTSSARSNFYNSTNTARAQIEGADNDGASLAIIQNYNANTLGGQLILAKSNAASVGSNTLVASGDTCGRISFQGNDGSQFVQAAEITAVIDATPGADDMPGRLVFSITADGASSPTERFRIGNAGGSFFYLNNGWSLVGSTAATAGTSSAIFNGRYGATAVDTGTNSFYVWSNGNVVNTNNSYGAISDIKLKENIVDAGSQWNDLKALQVRKYNFKEGQTHTQIGLVAQEAELVSPGLVSESPDRDEDGNDLGTVTKSVNYSVLYMKAVKALQEAMERIETLEASNTDLLARVTALEAQ